MRAWIDAEVNRSNDDLHRYRLGRVSEMSNGAIESARRATLPTKFATSRAAQSAQAAQKKWAVSAENSGKQPSPLKGHGVSPAVSSATNTAPIYARVSTDEVPRCVIEFLYTILYVLK